MLFITFMFAQRMFYIEDCELLDFMEKDMVPELEEFAYLPKFQDGRINYSSASRAAVLNCIVTHEEKILLLKRSDKVSNYRGKWNVIAGFLDEPKSLREKTLEELQEEIGISEEDIATISFEKPHEYHDPSLQKTWIIYPVRAELKRKPEIKLDWEHSDSTWIRPEELSKYDVVTGLDETVKKIIVC